MVDYSQTVYWLTTLDAYPLLKIEELVNKVALYKIYCTVDVKSAYHQVPVSEKDKIDTALEIYSAGYHLE